MICPLLTLASQDDTPGGAPLHDCIQADCAWWDGELEMCPLKAIAHHLTSLYTLACGIAEDHGLVD